MIGFECADLVAPTNQFRGVHRCRLNGFDRFHAPFDHLPKLFCVLAVGIHSGVSAEGDLRAGLVRVAEILTLQTPYLFFLFDGLRQHSGLGAFLQDEVIVVNVEH